MSGEAAPPARPAPRPGEESVWDYPRPPRVEASPRHLVVEFAGRRVADSRRALRVLETSQAPAYYFPPADVRRDLLEPSHHATWCEWKGRAEHFDVVAGGRRAARAAWAYPRPSAGYEVLRDHLAFYPGRVDACVVDGELAQPMPGGFYGGWVTADIVGPIKGGPGTAGW